MTDVLYTYQAPQTRHTKMSLQLVPKLTSVEKDILVLRSSGHSLSDIGEWYSLSDRTVSLFLNEISKKLGAKNPTHLCAKAIKLGLIDINDLD